jgi:hypothetical protein
MLRTFVSVVKANSSRRKWHIRAIATDVTAFCAAIAETSALIGIAGLRKWRPTTRADGQEEIGRTSGRDSVTCLGKIANSLAGAADGPGGANFGHTIP